MKQLMRLVGKFGSDFVAEAANVITPSQIGRPHHGDRPMLERINFAEWIQDTAKDYLRAGSKKPFRDAELDAHEMEHGNDHSGAVPESSLRTIKRKRIQGRKELNVVLEGARRRARSLNRRKSRL